MMGYMPQTPEITVVPPWPFFVRPILEALENNEPKARQDIFRFVINATPFSQGALEATVSSGQTVIAHRLGWALSHLVKSSWIVRLSTGIYQITDEGKVWLAANRTTELTYAEAHKIFKKYWPQKTTRNKTETPQQSLAPHEDQTPVESIENSINVLTEATKDELLARLRASDPTFFEKAVIKLLLAMGYGGAEQRGRQIGGTGDGGVDGVIDQDALGLEKIYVQAKRYAETASIGSATIREFIGALAIKGVSSGVFITTSSFTQSARDTAASPSHSIALIDGAKLASLMIKYRVGVQIKQTYEVFELDEDFFDDIEPQSLIISPEPK